MSQLITCVLLGVWKLCMPSARIGWSFAFIWMGFRRRKQLSRTPGLFGSLPRRPPQSDHGFPQETPRCIVRGHGRREGRRGAFSIAPRGLYQTHYLTACSGVRFSRTWPPSSGKPFTQPPGNETTRGIKSGRQCGTPSRSQLPKSFVAPGR